MGVAHSLSLSLYEASNGMGDFTTHMSLHHKTDLTLDIRRFGTDWRVTDMDVSLGDQALKSDTYRCTVMYMCTYGWTWICLFYVRALATLDRSTSSPPRVSSSPGGNSVGNLIPLNNLR